MGWGGGAFDQDHPDFVDQLLRLCRCKDEALFLSVLGATLHLGSVNEDLIHAVTHSIFNRIKAMLATATS